MRRAFLLAAVGLAMGAAGSASPATLVLDRPRPLSRDIAAFPRIAAPADAASGRINAALARLDRAALRAAAECRAEARQAGAAGSDWERTIAVTMKGPRLLSYLVSDGYFCGGAHPDAEAWPLVFDLATGSPVDWARFLPPPLVGKPATDTEPQTAGRISLASPRLHALYMALYRNADPDCREAMADLPEPAAASIWPEPAKSGLAVNFEVANAMAVCAGPVIIPLPRLRTLGASPDLIAALAAAR
ncbi:MAG TPA: hypothetical protein VGH15_03615 [Caulobacteraceae bacterium]